jgi:PHD/YefM family antitoxin component YafN of YafNO toxin-antitoxin module
MSTTLSVKEAQTQLPELVARAARDDEPCYIEHNGEAAVVLVSLRQWQRRGDGHEDAPASTAEDQEHRIAAYQEKLAQLGPDYWLPADQQARLKELVEKQELGAPLTSAEGKELRRLLKRHEQLLVKRASALHAMR